MGSHTWNTPPGPTVGLCERAQIDDGKDDAMAMVLGGGTRTDEPTIAPRGDEESAPRRESHERAAVSTIRTGAPKA